MLGSYDLILDNCEVRNLDVNHSFNFLAVARSTFAGRIEIHNSRFSNISGAVLELDKETDDLGLYNVEYVSIAGSGFENVGEALAVLYRGGTDESTFGPHFELRDSSLKNVGNGKRNKSKSSVALHGVQVATITGTRIVDSQPIRAMLTVGDPVTAIKGNTFQATPAPEILNGQAVVSDNTVIK
jgi:poly(beta-D-mannuronate) lyase